MRLEARAELSAHAHGFSVYFDIYGIFDLSSRNKCDATGFQSAVRATILTSSGVVWFGQSIAGAAIGRNLVAVLLRRAAGAAGRRRARHGVRRHRDDRDAVVRRVAGAGQRHGPHCRDFHHRGVRRVALVASQHRLVDRQAHRHSGRDRRRAGRDRPGQCRWQGDRAVRDHLSRADGRRSSWRGRCARSR